MSNNNNKSSTSALMIKLAPSPRDRSFRSQTSNTISSPRGSCSLSPRSGSDGIISPRSNNTTVAHNNKRHHRRNRSNGSNESPEISKSSYNNKKNVVNKNKLPVSPRCAAPTTSTSRENRIAINSPGGSSPGVRDREEQRGVISPPNPQQQHVTIASMAGVTAAISNSYSAAPTYEPAADKTMERQISATSGKVSTTAINKAKFSNNNNLTSPAAIHNNNNKTQLTPADKRTKRMLVVDPKSGRKYHLDEDDHSLTDKVLHVYHKKGLAARQKKAKEKKERLEREQQAIKANSHHARIQSDAAVLALPQHTKSLSLEEQTLNTLSTYNTLPFNDEHTLDTASALTEVSYGRYKFNSGGPLECFIPSSCKSLEHLALGDTNNIKFVNGEIDGNVREMRDDVESIERTRYEALLSATTGKEGRVDNNTNLGPLSPLSTAFQAITSSFFQTNNNNGIMPESAGMKEIKFRRICLVVFPDEVQSSLGIITTKKKRRKNNNGVGLLGMKFVQSSQDFQAHVSYVQRGSKADKMGVRKGDIVSFAVALSNMTEEQNSFLAEKLIKRLESVGMRTSYRELYDIFLSKTTNFRPIGLVFRRWRGDRASCLTSGVSAKDSIDNEFEWSSDFLQSLAIKCREFEFEQKVPLSMDLESDHANEQKGKKGGTESNNLLTTFLPRPNVDTTTENGLIDYVSSILDNLSCGNYGSPEIGALSLRKQLRQPGSSLDFLSNRTLCSLVEQSLGLIFLRRTGKTSSSGMFATSGSGFIVARKAEGSWSAPCFLTILGSKDKFTDHANDTSTVSNDVKMIIIRKNEMINNLIQGKPIKFSVHKEERANALVRDSTAIGVEEGRFKVTDDFFLAVKVNDEQNQGAYSSSTDHIEASDILTGTISPPEQSVDFYGALQSLELPYSMHSHPVIPDVLSPFGDSDWCELSSNCGLRTKLQMISKGNLPDDENEVDIFVRKFKYYLMDGVPLHQILSPGAQGLTEEKVLRMTINDPGSLFSSTLELTRKRVGVSGVGQSNFSTSFESITKLSRSPPLQVLSMLDEEERKRFFSVSTDLTPVPVMMLAKSKKDAMILLCGLKLLLEKEKMRQSS